MLISRRMVPTDAVIHFKFKNALETEKFPFSGASVSVRELKQFISQKHKLDQKSSRPDKSQLPSELSLENAATGEVYLSDDAEIPKDAVITVARKLAGAEVEEVGEPKQLVATPELPVDKNVTEKPVAAPGDVPYYHGNSSYNQYQGQQDPTFEKMGFPGVITESTDISEMEEYTEEQKIFAMMYQCLLFYDHTAYVSKPRQSVYCSHCKIAGSHNTKFCPNIQDVATVPSGRRNAQRAPTVAPTNVTTNPTAYASVPDDTYERVDIPPDLCCNICKNLLRDAVVAPCCGVSFCDACIRTTLMDEGGDSVCPSCEAPLAPDACSPNSYLRGRVEKWEREMQIKRQQKKKEGSPQSVGNKANAVKEEKPVPTTKESPLTNAVSTAQPIRSSLPGRISNVKPEVQAAVPRNAALDTHSEAKPIGSLISTTTHKIPQHIPTNLFHQQQQQSQPTAPQPPNQQTIASTEARRGSFPNNPQAANIAPYLATRMTGRQPPNPMNFFPGMNQFVDGSFSYLNPAFRNPMSAAASAAAFGMRSGMGNRMPYGLTPDMNRFSGLFPPQQTAEMYERQLRFANTAPSNILPSGQTLRVTRIMNNQKVPVQSPYDSDSPTRADKLREKDKEDYRRDKEEDRRRDTKPYDAKYDDRKDRRDDRKKREGSYKSDADDRRSSERRHSREKRFRNDSRSPDRKDSRVRKDNRKIRVDDIKYDRLAEKEARRDKRKDDTPKSEKTVSPVSKLRSDRVEPSPVVSEPKEKDTETVTVKNEKVVPVEETKISDTAKSVEKIPDEETVRKEREEREKKEKEARELEKRQKKEEQRRRREKREEEEKRRAQDKRERELEQREKQIEEMAKELERQRQEMQMQSMKPPPPAVVVPVVVKETVDVAELQKKAFGKWENDQEEERTITPNKTTGDVGGHGESVEETKSYSEDRKSHKSRSKKDKKAAKASKEKSDGASGEISEKKARRKHREGDGAEKDRVKRERNRQDEDVVQEPRDGEERKDKSGDYRKPKSSRSKRDESMRSSREKRPRSESVDRKDAREFKRLDSKTSEFEEGKSRERRSHKRDGDGEKSRKPSRSKKDKSRSSRRAEDRGKVKDRESDMHGPSDSRVEDETTEIKSGSADWAGRKTERISGENEKKERSSEKRERHKSSRKREKSSKEKRSRDGDNADDRDPRKKHKKRRKRDKKDVGDTETASAEAGDQGNVSPASID